MRTRPNDRRPKRTRHAAVALTTAATILLGRGACAEPPLEEIIVTARKRAEPLITVPLKLDVVTDDGGEPGVESLQNLIGRVPGLYFESAWGGAFSAPTLRGQQVSPVGDLNVGIFVDGVYQANPTTVDAGPIDVERIEVVRGPQSALFGHSTFAGAIHFVSAVPTEQLETGFGLETGSDGYLGANGYVSGPILGGALLGRLAIGARRFDGTQDNVAASGASLGGARRASIAMQLATPPREGFAANLSLRFSEVRYDQPAVASLTYRDYNCGAIEPASGAWSYYCGELPRVTRFDSSIDTPDSDDEVAQMALQLAWPLGPGTLTSTTSYYEGRSDVYRDFDASSTGQPFGVCALSSSCSGAGIAWPIERLVTVEEVWRQQSEVTEWNQELRWSGGHDDALQWGVGVVAWETDSRDQALLGAARGDLTDAERLTGILPLTPGVVGPQSLVNRALVADPNTLQLAQALDVESRRTVAFFGTLDFAFNERWRARLEARATRERRALDNLIANFAAGFGTAIPPQWFRDITPRVSLQYAPSPRWTAYVSAAKGSKSGGINPIPDLLPAEQSYEPEFNWTYEIAARYRPPNGVFGVDATVFSIDWTDAQIQGFGQTPNVSNLITLNTAGVRTKGIELSLHADPLPVLRMEIDLSWAEPGFRTGSDDPGSRRFCGLSGGNATSTFCVIGPSRTGAPLLVPHIDGNVPARVPQHTWHAGIAFAPRAMSGRLIARFDASGQDDVFDRAINGARFGQRTLVDARLSYDLGAWELALWGRNLGDERYVRALSSRGQIYFPTSPRPLDAIYGDGRRIGLSATHGTLRR
jgi:iron complex outermembrane receptor protein